MIEETQFPVRKVTQAARSWVQIPVPAKIRNLICLKVAKLAKGPIPKQTLGQGCTTMTGFKFRLKGNRTQYLAFEDVRDVSGDAAEPEVFGLFRRIQVRKVDRSCHVEKLQVVRKIVDPERNKSIKL